MAIDTACSSSLVAVHQAVRSLRAGESVMAVAGGVNLLLSPDMSVALSQAQMLSPDGRCNSFDASANGYVRSEGGGVVVLKRLVDAQRDGDPILAVIHGSAVNQDGRSNGLTAPNGLAQQGVIIDALSDARLSASQISFVEAHGSGTPLGDPIEVRSLLAVLNDNRRSDQPCIIGSVKSNIGHLEAAAGIAGLIKVVLSLQSGKIPGNAGFRELNPLISFTNTPFSIGKDIQDWPQGARYAGVSSFGFGGTNAHVILGEAPRYSSEKNDSTAESLQNDTPYLLLLSAETQPALNALCQRYLSYLADSPEVDLNDICYSSAVARKSLSHRLAIQVKNRQDCQNALNDFNSKTSGEWSYKLVDGDRKPVVWLFTGQGSQYTGMGKDLYDTETYFRDSMNRCNAVLEPMLGCSIFDILWDESFSQRLNETQFTQPALFALEVSLAGMLTNLGLKPDAVAGYSIGELSAACVAGVFSIDDGLRLAAERGRTVSDYASGGSMLAVMAPADIISGLITGTDGVQIATYNGPAGQVLAGSPESLEEVHKRCSDLKITTRKLSVSHAFHTDAIVPAQVPFRDSISSIEFKNPIIPIISSVTGQYADDDILNLDYWVNQLRHPVRFDLVMQLLMEQDFGLFIEIGPKPTLITMGRRYPGARDRLWLNLISDNEKDSIAIQKFAGNLWLHGISVDWGVFYSDQKTKKVPLPVYPFDRKRYWLDSSETLPKTNKSTARIFNPAYGIENYFVGVHIASPFFKHHLFSTHYSRQTVPFYEDHKVFGIIVVPGAGHLSMIYQAARKVLPTGMIQLQDVIFPQPMVISEDEDLEVQLIIEPESKHGVRPFKLISNKSELTSNAAYTLHSEGFVCENNDTINQRSPDIHLNMNESDVFMDDFYQEVWQKNITLGNSFSLIEKYRIVDDGVVTLLRKPDLSLNQEDIGLYPGLFDASLQAIVALFQPKSGEVLVPFSVSRMLYYGTQDLEVSGYTALLKRQSEAKGVVLFDVSL
jgi:myxalamid-type polyketide synthase MxaB